MERPTDDAEIRAHADLVYRTCMRLTGNAQDAADVSQEVFVAWLRARGTIRGPLGAWLHGTARQRALDFLRRGHRRARHEQQAEPPADAASEDGWRTHLDEALADLDGTSRALVIEHHLMGVDQGRLAQRFRCTQATVSRRLAQALTRLRALLERRGVQAAPALFPAWLTAELQQPPCPDPLVAPVLAQAHVGGAGALLGPAMIGGSWLLWVGLAAAAMLTLAALGGTGAWWWRTNTLRELDRDWTAVATAHLPPMTMKVAAPTTGPRYPSIERLIARLPQVDPARQERVRRLIAPAGEKPWSRFQALGERHAVGSQPVTAGQQKEADAGYALLRPLITELVAGDAMIGASAWLDEDYQAGRLGSWSARSAWATRLIETQLPGRMMDILIDHVERSADPVPALVELDALLQARIRSTLWLIDGLIALSQQDRRDALYLRLIYADRLPVAAARRWCAEASTSQGVMADALLGEVLFMSLPLIDDVRAGRPLEPLITGWDPLGSLLMARSLTWLPTRIAVIHDALHGHGSDVYRQLKTEADSVYAQMQWPAFRLSLVATAKEASSHRARRRAAELLLNARIGKPLPDMLTDPTAGPADAWKMRYERVSPTRFRLVVDPAAGSPAYAEDADTIELVTRLGLPHGKKDAKPLVSG